MNVIAYQGLFCGDRCQRDIQNLSIGAAALAFVFLQIILAFLIPGDFFLDLTIWNLYGYEIRTLIAMAAAFVAWAVGRKIFSKDCPACREKIEESHRPEKKIQWFGCI